MSPSLSHTIKLFDVIPPVKLVSGDNFSSQIVPTKDSIFVISAPILATDLNLVRIGLNINKEKISLLILEFS